MHKEKQNTSSTQNESPYVSTLPLLSFQEYFTSQFVLIILHLPKMLLCFQKLWKDEGRKSTNAISIKPNRFGHSSSTFKKSWIVFQRIDIMIFCHLLIRMTIYIFWFYIFRVNSLGKLDKGMENQFTSNSLKCFYIFLSSTPLFN